MKKIVCYLIAILLVLPLVLPSCGKTPTQKLPDISDYNSEVLFPVSDTEQSDNSETGESKVTGEFKVREKKYAFEGGDVVILNVENVTNRNYSIKIHGTYLDGNGNVLKEEAQTFEGFESGWKNYFLFWPEMTFDKFTYTLETEEFVGECAASKIEIRWNPDEEFKKYYTSLIMFTGNANDYGCTLGASMYFTNTGFEPMEIYYHVILLDSSGEIYAINHSRFKDGEDDASPHMPKGTKFPPQEEHQKGFDIVYSLGDDVSIPEELQGGHSFLVAVTGAKWVS